MNPAIGAALISGGAQLLGGLMGGDSGMRPEHQLLEQYKMQKEFAMHGIQWRADDARAAGLHPMAALGTSPTQFSPVGIWQGGASRGERMGDAFARAGQGLGNAYGAQLTPEQRVMNDAQLKVMEAQAANDLAQAQYWASEAARTRQLPMNAAPEVPGVTTHAVPRSQIEAHPLTYDHIKPKADEQVSARKGDRALGAGTHPGMREHVMRSGPTGETRIILPYSEEGPAEALESIPLWMYPQLIRDNTRRYGAGWIGEFLGFSDPGTSERRRLTQGHYSTRSDAERELRAINSPGPMYRRIFQR